MAYNRSNAVPDYQALLHGGREDLEEAQEDPHVVVRYQADMIKFLEVKVKDLEEPQHRLRVADDEDRRELPHALREDHEDLPLGLGVLCRAVPARFCVKPPMIGKRAFS